MGIEPVTLSSLGYRKIGPTDRVDPERTRHMGNFFASNKFYDVQTQGDERWARDIHRCEGVESPWFLRHIGTITSASFPNEDAYDFLRGVKKIQYGRSASVQGFDPGELMEKVGQQGDGQPAYSSMSWLAFAISMCPPEDLAEFLRRRALPEFFRRYGAGQALFFQSNDEVGHRLGLLRALFSLTHCEIEEFMGETHDGALGNWHASSMANQPVTLMALLGTLLYPHIYMVHGGFPGLRFVLLLDPLEKHKPSEFPAGWMSLPQSEFGFGRQRLDVRALLDEAVGSDEAGYSRRQFRNSKTFPAEVMAEVVVWFAARYSELSFQLAEPCEFLDNNDCVDPVTCFEYSLTVDRVLRMATSCVASDETAVRKGAVFEVADMLEGLRGVWDRNATKGTFFKLLLDPVRGPELLERAFEEVPSAFREYLVAATREIYDELLSVVRNSVSIPARKTGDGVRVKTRDLDGEQVEKWPNFIANVMRALRNTHHGYLTQADRSNRPSRYLALVSGDTPDSMNQLGLLWALALLASPKVMLGWVPMQLGAWPMSVLDRT